MKQAVSVKTRTKPAGPKSYRRQLNNLAARFIRNISDTVVYMVTPPLAAVELLAAAVSLIYIVRRKSWLLAAAALIVATPLTLSGFWYTSGRLGLSDWDYYFSYHEVLRRSLLEHGSFPFWNPYTCGGTAGLADPEFPLFTPTFLLELIFGIPTGFKLAIFLSVATTACGMLAVSRRLGLSTPAALLAALAATFGSVNLLEIVEGHPNVFAVMWLPWAFWAWIAAYRHALSGKTKTQDSTSKQIPEIKSSNTQAASRASWPLKLDSGRAVRFFLGSPWTMLTGLLLALMFFQGGIYLLSYTALALLAVILLLPHRRVALAVTVSAGLWALALSAVKLLPAVLWLRQFPDTAYASSTWTLPWLDKILLGRYLHGADNVIPNQHSGWHEYGAYLGPAVLALTVVGTIAGRRRRAVQILAIGTLLAILLSSAGPLLKPVFDRLPFIPRSNISRTILFAVIPLSLLAGFGLDALVTLLSGHRTNVPPGRGKRVAALITVALITFTAADLLTLAHALSYQAFVLPDVVPAPSPAPSPLAFSALTYETRHDGDDYTRAYAAVRAGYGSLSYCSPLTPEPAVRTIHDEGHNEIIALSSSAAAFTLQFWSPNQVVVGITAPEPTEVLLNTNYAAGWQAETARGADGGVPRQDPRESRPARNIAGRVGTRLPAGQHTVIFTYRTPGFIPGLAISLLALTLAGAAGIRAAADVIKRNRSLAHEPEVHIVL